MPTDQLAASTPSSEYLAEQTRLREIRNKTWEESKDDEKIEKLKMAIQDFHYLINRISTLETEIHRLKNHSHKENGDMVVPYSVLNNNSGLGVLAGSKRNILA